jgi:hypothetical protein
MQWSVIAKSLRNTVLWHVKTPFEVRKRYFIRQNLSFPLPYPPALLLDDSVGRWVNQEFFYCQYHSTMVLHTHISLRDKQQAHWWPQFTDAVSPHCHDHQ